MDDFRLFKRIRTAYPDLRPREKKVADYILKDYKVAAFLNCVKLGKAAGVSDTTVIRMANSIGFNGFTELKRALQDLIKSEVSPKEKLSTSINSIKNKSYLKEVYDLEMQNLESSFELIDFQELDVIIKKICNARKIFIMGLGTSAASVRFLTYRLRRVKKDVIEINSTAFTLVERSSLMSKDDIFIVFDFARYSNDVLKTIRYAREDVKITTVLITDSLENPFTEFADQQILVRNESLAFTNSNIGSDFVANLLSIGVVLKEKDKSVSQIVRNEKFAKLLGHSI